MKFLILFSFLCFNSFSQAATCAPASNHKLVAPGHTAIYEWRNSCPKMEILHQYFKDQTIIPESSKIMGILDCGETRFFYVYLMGDYGMVRANDVILQ